MIINCLHITNISHDGLNLKLMEAILSQVSIQPQVQW